MARKRCPWHGALEAVWLAAGQRETICGRFVQGLIQLAGAQSLTLAGMEKIAEVEGIYLGIDVAALLAEVVRCLREDRGKFPRIELMIT
ncbi:MAG: DUF309 domain-containing protein [Desulfuromonadales bacterium]|nr:DUF309 domain-containing protein [Desulfuromonadales bacterium]